MKTYVPVDSVAPTASRLLLSTERLLVLGSCWHTNFSMPVSLWVTEWLCAGTERTSEESLFKMPIHCSVVTRLDRT